VDTLLSVTDLHLRYGPVRAVDGIDLHVDAGEVVALLGPNGAGKTSLTRCVTGVLRPDQGTVAVLGHDPVRAATRRRIGVVQQDAGFPRTLRVGEAVTGAAVRAGGVAADASAALREVGMEAFLDRRATRLSGGQQRRVQLAMALVADPALLVLDEPTEGLDVTARREFWDMLGRRRDAGTGVLLTTHAVAEAAEVADRVVVIEAGRVVATGTPGELAARAASRRIRLRTSVDVDTVAAWPEVTAVEAVGRTGHLDITGDPAEPVVRRLFALDPDLTDLTVTTASLADAVALLHLPADDLEPVS
jgi:ABC-2 type transport system ATP-binding protein